MAQLASVLAWGASGRPFESGHPDGSIFSLKIHFLKMNEKALEIGLFLFNYVTNFPHTFVTKWHFLPVFSCFVQQMCNECATAVKRGIATTNRRGVATKKITKGEFV